MVDPKLFEFVGYDLEVWTGFAFGWGLERIAVLRHVPRPPRALAKRPSPSLPVLNG